MSSQDNQAIINDNAGVIRTFVMEYLLDNGTGVQLVEAVAKELFGQQVVVNGTVHEDVAASPKDMISTAVQDVVQVGLFSATEFDLQRVIDGAASLEFLVRYARKVNPAVFPPSAIPSDEVVNATLAFFNASKLASTTY